MIPCRQALLPVLLAAGLALVLAAGLRGAEYDEQYTLFLTAGAARPDWPADAFPAGEVRRLQAGHAGFAAIAHDLRATDVHPPLYFWTIAAWRWPAGGSLIAARMASVLCSLAALGMVAAIARISGIPPVSAVLLTLGCYGFVYTGTIARGFALAQLLTLAGVAALLWAERRPSVRFALAGGGLLGAATFSNYLAGFVGGAALLWALLPVPPRVGARGAGTVHPSLDPLPQGEGEVAAALPMAPRRRCPRRAIAAVAGFAVWLPADLWFFLAQRHSRPGQFAAFDAVSATMQLAASFAANLLGGLPRYLHDGADQGVAASLAVLLIALAGLTVWRWRRIATPGPRLLLTMAAAAPALGLLLLGCVFDSTPIELRYLAFTMPFVGLLLAGMFATLPRRAGHALCGLVLAIQTLSLIGLMTRQETMQPARASATAAAALVGDGVVLLPRGNDGVGIVGAFAIEARPALRLMVVGRDATATAIRARAGPFPRVVLALLGQDADSRATLTVMRAAFADPCWRKAGEGFDALAYERICGWP